LFSRRVDSAIAGLEEAKNLAGKCPPPDSDPRSDAEFGKNLASVSRQFAASANHRCKGDSPGDKTGHSLNPAESHASALWLFPKQTVPQRIDRVIFARGVDLLRVARGVNQRGQSANQVRAAAAKDFQASASPAILQRQTRVYCTQPS